MNCFSRLIRQLRMRIAKQLRMPCRSSKVSKASLINSPKSFSPNSEVTNVGKVEDIRTSAATYLVKLTRDLALRQSSTDQQLKAACDVLLQILQLDIGNQYKLRIATGLQFLMDRLGKALRH